LLDRDPAGPDVARGPAAELAEIVAAPADQGAVALASAAVLGTERDLGGVVELGHSGRDLDRDLELRGAGRVADLALIVGAPAGHRARAPQRAGVGPAGVEGRRVEQLRDLATARAGPVAELAVGVAAPAQHLARASQRAAVLEAERHVDRVVELGDRRRSNLVGAGRAPELTLVVDAPAQHRAGRAHDAGVAGLGRDRDRVLDVADRPRHRPRRIAAGVAELADVVATPAQHLARLSDRAGEVVARREIDRVRQVDHSTDAGSLLARGVLGIALADRPASVGAPAPDLPGGAPG